MSPRRAPSANLAFLVLMILTVLAVAGGTAYVIQRLRTSAVADALNSSTLHARAFEDHLTRSLGTIQRLTDFIATGPAVTPPEDIDALFQRSLRQLPFIRSLCLLDDRGRVIASSNPANLGQVIDNSDYFPPPSTHPADGLRIGRPWSGRDWAEGAPATGRPPEPAKDLGFVPVLCAGEGHGRQVNLLATLNPDFFINYYGQWLNAETGFVEILRYDRAVLLTSGDLHHPGEQHPDETLAALLEESEIGQYEGGTEPQCGTFTAFRASRQFPLLVVAHLYRERALAGWHQESRRLLLLVGPALLGMVLLTTILYRRERHLVAEEAAAQRRAYERLAATVFETIHEAVVVTNPDQVIVTVNPAFSRITGYPAEEATGSALSLIASGYHNEEFFKNLQETLESRGHWEGEIRNRRKSGEIFVAWLSINLVRDEMDRVTHQVLGFSDITEYRAEADRVAHLAHHDLLTGLPNRALLADRLRQSLHQAQRNQNRLALIFFDLDRFKPVNDSLGHAVGDRLLQALAVRLAGSVRSADTLARLGGDEFVVLLPVIDDHRDASVVAEKILQAVHQPILLDQHQICISSSIGIALYPDHAEDGAGLMRCADTAMYHAKRNGGGRVQLYPGDTLPPDA